MFAAALARRSVSAGAGALRTTIAAPPSRWLATTATGHAIIQAPPMVFITGEEMTRYAMDVRRERSPMLCHVSQPQLQAVCAAARKHRRSHVLPRDRLDVNVAPSARSQAHTHTRERVHMCWNV